MGADPRARTQRLWQPAVMSALLCSAVQGSIANRVMQGTWMIFGHAGEWDSRHDIPHARQPQLRRHASEAVGPFMPLLAPGRPCRARPSSRNHRLGRGPKAERTVHKTLRAGSAQALTSGARGIGPGSHKRCRSRVRSVVSRHGCAGSVPALGNAAAACRSPARSTLDLLSRPIHLPSAFRAAAARPCRAPAAWLP